MTDEVYCSLCSRCITAADCYICARCGLVVCPHCYSEGTILYGGFYHYLCLCGSEEVLSFNELRMKLVKDLLDLRTKIRHAVYLPIRTNNEWATVVENLRLNLNLSVAYNFGNIDFQLRDTVLTAAETFIYNYLEELSSKLRFVYNKSAKNLRMSDVKTTNELRFDMRYYEGNISNFQSKILEKLDPLTKNTQELAHEYARLKVLSENYRKNTHNIRAVIQPGEQVAAFSKKICYRSSKFSQKKIDVLVSINRIVFLKKSHFRRKYITLLTIDPDVVTDVIDKLKKDLLIKTLTKNYTLRVRPKDKMWLLDKLKSFQLGRLKNYRNRAPLSQQCKWDAVSYESKLTKYLSFFEFNGTPSLDGCGQEKLEQYVEEHFHALLEQKRVFREVLRDLRSNYEAHKLSSADYYRILEEYSGKMQKVENDIYTVERMLRGKEGELRGKVRVSPKNEIDTKESEKENNDDFIQNLKRYYSFSN